MASVNLLLMIISIGGETILVNRILKFHIFPFVKVLFEKCLSVVCS